MRGKKAQTAIELLTVYGWVVLLILILLIVGYYSGFFDLGKILPTYCTFTPTMSCSTFRFGYWPDGKSMVLVYRIVNGIGYDILFPNQSVSLMVENIGKSGKSQYVGDCFPTSSVIAPGSTVTCVVRIQDMNIVPSLGKNLNLKMKMRYKSCNLAPNYEKTHDCTLAPEYNVTGAIKTQMEYASTALYACGDGICDYMLGENPTNCCNDCRVFQFWLTSTLSNPKTYDYIGLIANAKYSNGRPAEGATVYFGKLTGEPDPEKEDLYPRFSTTNSSGQAISYYSTKVAGPVTLNASTCGGNATITLNIIEAPANGTILFSWHPPIAPAGGYYEVNITLYNLTGQPVPFIDLFLRADDGSSVTPNPVQTDANGIAHVNFSSNITHVGRLTARAVRVFNSTNLIFSPSPGRLILWTSGPANVSSEANVSIYGCLYNTNGDPISDAVVTLTTDFGYFPSLTTGPKKLDFVTAFQTRRSTMMYQSTSDSWYYRPKQLGVGYEIFGYNGTNYPEDFADPVELDAYAGKFVKLRMTYHEERTKAGWIAKYLSWRGWKGTGERKIYVFYNTSYSWESWVRHRLFFNNLTQNFTAEGITYTNISDPLQLRDIMLYKANESIVISATEYLPEEVWDCSTSAEVQSGGIPKLFFQRGGIYIHTGDWDFYYSLRSDGGYNTCSWEEGSHYIFGYYTATSNCDWCWSLPLRMSTTTTARTFPGGCFNATTTHPELYSTLLGVANVTGTYYSMSNSTLANFTPKRCSDGTLNGSCSSTKPLFCVNGYLYQRCDICQGCPDPVNQLCDLSNVCIDKQLRIILSLRTFNGTGVELPNDGYTRLQVIAQVFNASGNQLEGVEVEWESRGVLIRSVECTETGYDCGDYTAQPSPSDPRAAIYVTSNGSWTGIANVTAKVKLGGSGALYVTNTTNITVTANRTVGRIRWTSTTPSVVPADNYTRSVKCIRVYGLNDSVLGSVSVCFNSTSNATGNPFGIFDNNASLYCSLLGSPLLTDEYGEACGELRSGIAGYANVTALVQNLTRNVTYYEPNLTRFYELPTSIEMNLSPNPARPSAHNSSSRMVINSTFRNATGSPIAGIPYVYYYIPYPYDWPRAMVTHWTGWIMRGWRTDYGRMQPAYYPDEWECRYVDTTTGVCSRPTLSDGSTYTNLTPVYPPGTYWINVSTWYNCDAEPFSPENCGASVSNRSLINVSPIPRRIIFDLPINQIRPNYTARGTATFTIYGSDNNPMPRVFWYEEITPDGPDYDITEYHTNNSGREAVRNLRYDISGNYTLTIYSYYYNDSISDWVEISNSTNITFGPVVQTIIVNASPTSAYADGFSCSEITITLTDSTGNRMNSAHMDVNPPTAGLLSCCGSVGCGCYDVHTDSNGQYKTSLCSQTVGNANASAYVQYTNTTAFRSLTNYTIVNFKEPPTTATMTTNPSVINGDGVNRSLITVRFVNSSGGPTPGIVISCNVSVDSVFFPSTGFVTDSNGQIYTNLSSLEDPATIMCWSPTLVIASANITVASVNQPRNLNVTLTASPNATVVGLYSFVLANVTNASTGAAKSGVLVNFTTSWGGRVNVTGVVTNASGLAAVNATAIGVGEIFVKANVSGDFGVVKIKYT